MVYKFRIISDEVDDFLREIQIDSEASFYDLHEAILKSTGYKDDQMTSFFICDDDWEKETEITLEDMGSGSSEEDTYIMRETPLSELLEDEKQKLVRVNDILKELTRQLAPMEKQAATARIYLQKKKELKSYDINLFLTEYEQIAKELEATREKQDVAQAQLEETKAEYE